MLDKPKFSCTLNLNHSLSVMEVDCGILFTFHPNPEPEDTVVETAKLFFSDIITANRYFVNDSLITFIDCGERPLPNSLIEAI